MTTEESKALRRAYENWELSLNESPVEYLLRVRAVGLSTLLKMVIANELSETERQVICQYWFEGMKSTDIAEKMGVNRATVSRTLERANSKIYDSLKYVIRYQQGVKDTAIMPIAIGEALAQCASLYFKPKSIGERIRALRIRAAISIEKFSSALQISKKILLKIENGTLEPSIAIIAGIAAFLGTSTDYIITGKGEKIDEQIAS